MPLTSSYHWTKKRFSANNFLVNVSKSQKNCGFGHIYWRNSILNGKLYFFCCLYLKIKILEFLNIYTDINKLLNKERTSSIGAIFFFFFLRNETKRQKMRWTNLERIITKSNFISNRIKWKGSKHCIKKSSSHLC